MSVVLSKWAWHGSRIFTCINQLLVLCPDPPISAALAGDAIHPALRK